MKNLLLILLLMSATLGCQMLNRFSAGEQKNASADDSTAAKNTGQEKTAVQELCVNAYYPIGAEVERTYKIVYEGGVIPNQTYTQSYSDVSADKFTERNIFEGVQNALNYKCTEAGLQGLQFAQGNIVSSGNMTGNLETVSSEGVTFPPESRWRVGEKWSNSYQVRYKMQTGGKTDSTAEAVVTSSNEIVGEESVTVPAGTFQTFKVKNTLVMRYTSLNVNGMNVPMQPITINTDAYFAKNTGIVKSVVNGMGKKATTELTESTNSR